MFVPHRCKCTHACGKRQREIAKRRGIACPVDVLADKQQHLAPKARQRHTQGTRADGELEASCQQGPKVPLAEVRLVQQAFARVSMSRCARFDDSESSLRPKLALLPSTLLDIYPPLCRGRAHSRLAPTNLHMGALPLVSYDTSDHRSCILSYDHYRYYYYHCYCCY